MVGSIGNLMKRGLIIGVLAIVTCFLCACFDESLSRKNEDNTKTTVTGKGSFALARCPKFRTTSSSIIMSFNGYDWYELRIISKREYEGIVNNFPHIAKSTNIDVYQSVDEYYPYIYVIDLEGTDDSYIQIDSTDYDSRRKWGYGMDFDYMVEYRVGSKYTIPDIEGITEIDVWKNDDNIDWSAD